MKKFYHIPVVVILISSKIVAIGNSDKHTLSEKEKSQLYQSLRGSGLCFTPNKGQIADRDGKLCPDILYKGSGGGADIYLRTTGISYVFSNMDEVMHEVHEKMEEMEHYEEGLGNKTEGEWEQELLQKESIKVHQVDMDFEGANKNTRIINENEIEGYNNYYYAHCPNGVLNVKQYNKVTYKNIYRGIDAAYYGSSEKGIKYDLVVQAHADPAQIKLHWTGAQSIHLNPEGHLVIKTSLNEFTESIPKVYQNINGKIVDVKTKYVLTPISKGEAIINFSFLIYNSSFPLVIDPWATYYGGTGVDYGNNVACDNTGNVYMAGYTMSPNAGNVIATAGGFQTGFGGGFYDVFLVKFNSGTGARTWATYYGGTGWEYGCSVACDNTGNVYLAGYTDSPNAGNVIATAGGFQTVFGGGFYDAFLVKFNSATGARTWATYYGGTDEDYGCSVACDNTGNVYLAGYTQSPNAGNVIATAGGFQTGFAGGLADAFLVKFNSTTGGRTWATYYGGTGLEYGYSVACDNSSNVYLAGHTQSPNTGNVIATAGGFQTVLGGISDAYLVEFNSATGGRTWATYYGGTGWEYGNSVACDNTGNVYLAGKTNSPNAGNVIADAGGFQTVFGGMNDAYLVKFNSATGARTWGTYYGSNLNELVTGGWAGGGCLAIDGNNNVYLYMEVEDKPGPALIDPCAYQPNYAGGGEDQLIVKFNPEGQKLCATYFGGTGYEDLDSGGGIAVSGNLLFICASNGNGVGGSAGGYPVSPGAHQTAHGGGAWDAVLACLCINICEGKTSLGLGFTAATSVCANTPVTFTPTISKSCDTTGYKYYWVFSGGSPASSDSVNPTVVFSGLGTHDVKLVVTTLCKKDSITQVNYIATTQCVICNLVGQFTKGTANCSASGGCGCKEWIMVNASGGTSPYSYTWPDGYDKRYKNQLCPGSYTINIKDQNDCSVNINLTTP